jgi:choline-sulfatase
LRTIFFDIDCLRPDHLGCYGYDRPTSPSINAVAEQGVRFTRYFCANSPCLPSRMNWSSGRFGHRNGVVSNVGAGAQFHIRTRNYGGPQEDNDMLMRRLRRAGVHPVSFSNFADRHNMFWFECGWAEFHTPNLKGGGENADEIHEPLMRWLAVNARREDYLLHINYWDAHRIYRMDASWADRFKDYPVTQPWPDDDAIERHQSIEGPFTAHRQFRDDKSVVPLMPGSIGSRKDFEHMVTGYDAAIAYVDHHLGIVINELAAQGLLEDTAIIITSDHGDSFGEHGIYSDHVNADECIHHIPLVMQWPGVAKPGSECDSMLYNLDLAPTLCELFGADIPEDWDGASFAPQVRGEKGKERDRLFWGHALYTVQRAVRTNTHLMIQTYDGLRYGHDETELYDIVNDRYQTHNIAREHEDIVRECKDWSTQWLDEQKSKPHWQCDPYDTVLAERRAQKH